MKEGVGAGGGWMKLSVPPKKSGREIIIQVGSCALPLIADELSNV